MPTLSLSISQWRLLRRLLHAGRSGGTFSELRAWHRKDHDQRDFTMLVRLGYAEVFTRPGETVTRYRVTAEGRVAADMGEYESERLQAAPVPPKG